jgi:hypothetical protein
MKAKSRKKIIKSEKAVGVDQIGALYTIFTRPKRLLITRKAAGVK